MHYIPRNVSVYQHQVSHCVRTFDAVLRTNLYRFFIRYTSSSNFFIRSLQMSDAFHKSAYFLNYSMLLYGGDKCSSCPWIVLVFASHQYWFCVVKVCGHCVHIKRNKKKKLEVLGKTFAPLKVGHVLTLVVWCATVWLSIFCALANDDIAMVRIVCKRRFCNVRWCIANHFLCSCVCDMDHESAIKYYYINKTAKMCCYKKLLDPAKSKPCHKFSAKIC